MIAKKVRDCGIGQLSPVSNRNPKRPLVQQPAAHCLRLGQHGIVDLKKKRFFFFNGAVLGDVSVDFNDQ